MELDPEQVARERRIDEAAVDVELAWEKRAQAEQIVAEAEAAAAAAIERLLDERLAVREVIRLTGLEATVVRRLRHLDQDKDQGAGEGRIEAAGVERDGAAQ